MKLLHYMSDNPNDLTTEYLVLTEADEDKERSLAEVVETFRKDGFSLSGSHDVEPANGRLPLETEFEKS